MAATPTERSATPDAPDRATHEEALRAAAGHRTLEDVVRWGLLHSPPLITSDVIAQDEFTFDVVLPYGGIYLVYDTT